MRQQFGFLFHYTRIIKFVFALQLDQISSSCYLLQSRRGVYGPFGKDIASHVIDVTKRLTRVPMEETAKELVHRTGLGTVTVHTEAG